jgi:Holliday junction resolvasome RuvABC ATP-dependent DNA helicase subunit
VHLKKTEKVPFSKENPGARAALLSGPPGIGKSTVAALAAREGGYDVSLPVCLYSGTVRWVHLLYLLSGERGAVMQHSTIHRSYFLGRFS